MKKIFIKTAVFLMLVSSLYFCGCAAVEGAGRFLDGSVFQEKRIALFKALEKNGSVTDMELAITRNKSNVTSIIITMAKFPMFKLRAVSAGEDGAFNLSSLEYLAGSTHGWIEYSLELIGEGMFNPHDGIFEITEVETVQITKGRIHRYDTRITGNEALTALRNRRERVQAITAWMLSQQVPSFAAEKEFSKYWEPRLFPEIVPARKRPLDWLQEGDERQKTEDIRWNHSYTQRLFPEELQIVRNSGTMLRDWEEALSWIYLEYEWNNIVELLSSKIKFSKIK